MYRARLGIVLCVLLLVAGLSTAADVPVAALSGVVSKATPNVLTVKPRLPDGRFDKTVVLKLRGTSKITAVSTQTRNGQVVVVQRDVDPADLQPNQGIVAIYATLKDELVLLSAVVRPTQGK